MKITKEELIELGACEEGLDRFITQTNNTDEPVEVSSLVGGKNIYSDLLWLAGNKLPTERIVRFACDCALINIEKIEPYTDEYDMIVDFLRNPATHVATDAADATDAAVRTACNDTHNGNNAARAAARAAAYAANACTYAANACTYVAVACTYVTSAALAENRDKVDELLKELFA